MKRDEFARIGNGAFALHIDADMMAEIDADQGKIACIAQAELPIGKVGKLRLSIGAKDEILPLGRYAAMFLQQQSNRDMSVQVPITMVLENEFRGAPVFAVGKPGDRIRSGRGGQIQHP